jgi:hypothetical protein
VGRVRPSRDAVVNVEGNTTSQCCGESQGSQSQTCCSPSFASERQLVLYVAENDSRNERCTPAQQTVQDPCSAIEKIGVQDAVVRKNYCQRDHKLDVQRSTENANGVIDIMVRSLNRASVAKSSCFRVEVFRMSTADPSERMTRSKIVSMASQESETYEEEEWSMRRQHRTK